jgi:hypothetical protein
VTRNRPKAGNSLTVDKTVREADLRTEGRGDRQPGSARRGGPARWGNDAEADRRALVRASRAAHRGAGLVVDLLGLSRGYDNDGDWAPGPLTPPGDVSEKSAIGQRES